MNTLTTAALLTAAVLVPVLVFLNEAVKLMN